MATLAEFRQSYPQYNDMPDGALADALYKKFYSDMPRADFDAKIGLQAAQPSDASAAPPAAPAPGPRNPHGIASVVMREAGATPPPTQDDEDAEPGAIDTINRGGYQFARGAIAGTLGAPSDFVNLLRNSAASVFGGQPNVRPPGGSAQIGEGLDWLQNKWDRMIGLPEIGAPPKTGPERLINATGSGVGSVLAPLAAIKALSGAGAVIPETNQVVGALTNFFKNPTWGTLAKELGLAGVSGAGAETAAEAFPGNPVAPLVGGIVAPTAVAAPVAGLRAGVRAGTSAALPLRGAGPRQIAGDVLRESATDPSVIRRDVVPPITGQEPTLGQATRDPGIAALEQAAATAEPAPFVAQRSANNQVIRRAAEGASEGNPEAIRQAVEGRQTNLQGAAQRAEDRAAAGTQEAVQAATPTGANRETAAENLHRDIIAQHAASEEAERAAWAPINAVKDLKFETQPIKDSVDTLVKSLPRADRAALPQTLTGIVKDWGGSEPFAELTSLKSAVGSAARTAARSGDANTARVIGKLETVLSDHLDNPALLGDALEGEPNEIKAAYDNARAVTRAQKQQFNTDTETAPLFQRTGTGDVKVAPTETMARFVKPGPGGKEAFESLVTALGGQDVLEKAAQGEPTALNHVRDWAMSDIQGEPLTTKNLTAWRDKYSGILDAFPQLRSDLDTVGQRVARQEQVAQRRQSLSNMIENNAANKFTEGEPEWALGQLLKSTNLEANDKAVAQFTRFIKRSPEAMEGTRRTMVDLLMHAGENSATDLAGDKFLSSPKMVKFYEKNGRVFDALFPDKDQRALVDRIVQGVKMNGLAGEGATATGGPNTAQKLAGVERFKKLSGDKYIDALVGGGATKLASGLIGAVAAVAGGVHGAIGALVGAAEGPKVLQGLYARPREQVMSIVNEALRDPSLARDLMRDATPRNDRIVGPRLIRFLGGVAVPARAAAAEDEGEE